MDSTATTVILALAGAWIIQYYFAWWQMRRFYKRIADLRRTGLVSVGMAGSAWRRKQYAVLVVDKDHTITHVEQLSGWTVMASLKPVAGLDGRPMNDLWEDDAHLPVSPKLLLALQNAAGYIRDRVIREADAEVETAQLSESATESATAT
jgi:DNA-binding transcriptional regulator of glucitol operon